MPDDAAYPLWEGDSIGFWDGDKLVVHTTHVRSYPQVYYRSGPPQSEGLSAVKVIRKLDADHIEDAITIYDPNILRPRGAYFIVISVSRRARRSLSALTNGSAMKQQRQKVGRRHNDPVVSGEPGYKRPDEVVKPPTK